MQQNVTAAVPTPPPKLKLPPPPVLASDALTKARGVSSDGAPPLPASPPPRLMLPSPEQLGIHVAEK